MVVGHTRRVGTPVGIAWNKLYVDGACRSGDLYRPQKLPLFEKPYPDAASQVQASWNGMQGCRRANEIACDHKVQLGSDRYPVWVEAVVWRIRGVLGDKLEILVELSHSAWVRAIGPAHHCDEKAALW